MLKHFSRLYHFLVRENVLKLLIIILGITVTSGFLISLLEPDLTFGSGIWWSIVTLTTVGYGDISPSTDGGRFLAIVIMFFGIGLLGILSASLASMFITFRLKERRGMIASAVENHIIICEWNHRAKTVYKELRADLQTKDTPIVLIAALEETPVEDDPLFVFISGVVHEETLKKANLEGASTIIILGDDTIEETARDAKVILTTLTVEALEPQVYSIVELVDAANKTYCERAHADEIIVGSELNSNLIASAASDHGVSRIVSELLSSQYGNEMYTLPVSPQMVGKSFIELFIQLKKEKNITIFGLQKGKGGETVTNPDGGYIFSGEELLLVISKDRDLNLTA